MDNVDGEEEEEVIRRPSLRHHLSNPYQRPRNEILNKHSGYYVHSLYINSRNRSYPTTDTVGDFHIELRPNDAKIVRVSLKQVTLPFAFNNVTQQYGNTLALTVYGDRNTLFPVYQFEVKITPGWYSISALIMELNIKIAQQLTLLGATFQLTFSFSSLNGTLQLNTTDNNVMVTFNPLYNNLQYTQRYLYFMLGLSKIVPTTLFQTARYSERLPFVASQELPFNAILIYIDLWPNFVFTTGTTAGTFIIPTSNYKGLDTLSPNPVEDVSHGITWSDENHFKQEFTINRTVDNLGPARIKLTDDQGNSLTHYIQENDWAMVLEFEKLLISS